MHVLFLSPDTHIYNHGFLLSLKELGARVSAIGPASRDQLSAAAKDLATPEFDRIETIDEPLVDPAAALREHFDVPGLSLKTTKLCRDKVAMKEGLDRGWLVNTWFRLKHENYDKLRELMTFLGETVRAEAH